MGNRTQHHPVPSPPGSSGQVIVEYVLGITIAILVAGILTVGLRRPLQRLWLSWNDQVSASCPKCPPPQ